MAKGVLRIKIAGDASGFSKTLGGVSGKLNKFGGKVSNVGRGMTKWVTGPMAGATAGLGLMLKKTADAGDAIDKMSKRTGISATTLSEFKHAAELSGSSLESVEKGVKRMQKSIYDAGKGLSTPTDALDALNMSVEDLDGLNPEQQFEALSEAIAGVEDPSKRAALAQDIFGRAGTEMLPMLADGADGLEAMREEAHELGVVFDEEAAAQAAQFNDDLDRLKKGFAGAFQEIAMNLMPVLVDELLPALKSSVIPAVRDLGSKFSGLVEWFIKLDPKWQKLIGLAVGFVAALGPALFVIGKFISLGGKMIAMVKGLSTAMTFLAANPIVLVAVAVAALVAGLVIAYKQSETFRDIVNAAWAKVQEAISYAWENVIKPVFETLKEFTLGTLIPAFAAFKDYLVDTVWPKVSGAIKWAWDKVIEPVWSALKYYVTEILIPVFQDILSVAETVWEGISAAVKWAWENIIKPAWQDLKGYIDDPLKPVFETLREVAETVFGALETAVGNAWEFIEPKLQALHDILDGPLGTAFGAFKQAAETTFGALKTAVRTALDVINPMLSGLLSALQKVADLVGADNLASGLGAASNAMGSASAPATAGGMTSRIPRMAAGGIVTEPTLALIGERGPEAVVPVGRAGQVGARDQISGYTVNIQTMTVVANDPRELMESLDREIAMRGRARGVRA